MVQELSATDSFVILKTIKMIGALLERAIPLLRLSTYHQKLFI